jgi:hypothetical protein
MRAILRVVLWYISVMVMGLLCFFFEAWLRPACHGNLFMVILLSGLARASPEIYGNRGGGVSAAIAGRRGEVPGHGRRFRGNFFRASGQW